MGKPRTIKGRAMEVARRLAEEYPAECALAHRNPYELLVATVLSAQTTDERVNMVTPELFRRWPNPADLAKADPAKVEHELGALLPPKEWGPFSLRLILHGRKICIARRPKCADCALNDICPSSRVPA